ncbi:UDP-glucose 4-epimerase GalE [Nitrospirota bacterium]
MRVLVTGGAGYIGSVFVKELLSQGHVPVILDNFSTGNEWAVLTENFYRGDTSDRDLVLQILGKEDIDAVVHFAAFSLVGESVKEPSKYFQNNYVSALNILDCMVEAGVKYFILSSTAAVYGMPEEQPIREESAKRPINPYGLSKSMLEDSLAWYSEAHGLTYTSLRYFNAAGADPELATGEAHLPETHLIPLVLQAYAGIRDKIIVNGRDYDTPDGTCVRDYIHVTDLAQGHLLALDAMLNGGPSIIYNLGTNNGFSVLEIIRSAEEVTGKKALTEYGKRRAGDPPVLVADSSKIRMELGWKPKYEDPEFIISHAWQWLQKAIEKGYIKT